MAISLETCDWTIVLKNTVPHNLDIVHDEKSEGEEMLQ
jgi:hypothetical protein